MTLTWGLLGPGKLGSERRVRTLGVASSVRLFNELAVPGLGHAWFGKQLFLPTLGVRVAQHAQVSGRRVTNIETANAIEALACWLTFAANNWERDARMRGSTKMQGKNDLSFRAVRRPDFYVTQPMRMGIVEALPALGLVVADGARFNAFACSKAGEEFLDAACADFSPFNRSVVEHLALWVSTKYDDINVKTTSPLRAALSPIDPLPLRAREMLRDRLKVGGERESVEHKERRRNALAWVEAVYNAPPATLTWDARPAQITAQHWADMRAGALFVAARNAAMDVLDALETHIGNQGDGQRFSLRSRVPDAVAPRLATLKQAATRFLAAGHSDKEANAFCIECSGDDPIHILKGLATRDGRVLRLKEQDVVPGPAFLGFQRASLDSDDDEAVETPIVADRISWPQGISFRVRNLFLLNADLKGDLSNWLIDTPIEEVEA
jgi:hypothetical protein